MVQTSSKTSISNSNLSTPLSPLLRLIRCFISTFQQITDLEGISRCCTTWATGLWSLSHGLLVYEVWHREKVKYTAQLWVLFHQSPMQHRDYTVTGQWQYNHHWQLLVALWLHSCVVTMLLAVNNSDYTVTVQSPCSPCASRWLVE